MVKINIVLRNDRNLKRCLKKMIQKLKIKNVQIHAALWFGYSLFIHFANLFTRPGAHYYKVVLFLLPFALVFYLGIFLLNYFSKIGWLKFVLSFVLCFIITSIFAYVFLYKILSYFNIILYKSDSIKLFLQNAILGNAQYFTYASLYYYVKDTFNKEKKLRKLEEEKLLLEQQKIQNELENSLLIQKELETQKDKLQYEYAFLRAQVNPHFLHNTLNVLFSQALNHSSDLADNIQKLSKLMRYSIESLEYESGKVLLSKELEHLETLLDIHYLRFSENNSIQFELIGDFADHMVPPLSIMTVVENAIKYGYLKDKENPLVIRIVLSANELYFYCHNLKRKTSTNYDSTNIGLSNLKKRLNVAFENKYEMKVTENETTFTYELYIKK
jgi:sensor histidine kinase YesM